MLHMNEHDQNQKNIQHFAPEGGNEHDSIEVSWIERDGDDDSRRGTMYCFKSCKANQN